MEKPLSIFPSRYFKQYLHLGKSLSQYPTFEHGKKFTPPCFHTFSTFLNLKALPFAASALLFIGSLLSCHLPHRQKTPTRPSQAPSFAAEWHAIDSLGKQGLFKSALERVENLGARAQAEGNGREQVKTAIFYGKYAEKLGMGGLSAVIQHFETAEKTTAQPWRAVLQSLLADLYAQYLSSARWEIAERTPLANEDSSDIQTWSVARLEKQALKWYAASLQPATLLQSIPASDLGELLIPGNGDSLDRQPLRPFLYDLLAHRAILHFSKESSYLSEPAYRFSLDQKAAFAGPEDFVRTTFQVVDTSSHKWLAMRTFQDITRRHLQTGAQAALLDATLIRLRFAQENSSLPQRKDFFFNALEALYQRFEKQEGASEILFEMANYWVRKAMYTPSDQPNDFRRRAAGLCQKSIGEYPRAHGAKLCQLLLADLLKTYLDLTIEEVVLPERPILVKVDFKNLPQLWVRVYQGNSRFNKDLYNDAENYPNDYDEISTLNKIKKATVVQTKQWQIPDPGDYEQHGTEIKLEPLPAGHFILLISDNAAFDEQRGAVCWSTFSCSNLAAVAIEQAGKTSFVLLDRATGAPVAGVQGVFTNLGYGSANGLKIGENFSDANGFMPCPFQSDNPYSEALFIQNKDTLQFGTYELRTKQAPMATQKITFFTDRGLYRPGQTIYFKGILLEIKGTTTRILPNTKVTVELRDPNGQTKSTLQLKTNEYGTINGTFTAPLGGLTGRMSIFAKGMGGHTIQVEEYKRPKFEVKWLPVTGSYRLNDTVTATLEALNYTGSPVDGAKVVWRVTRRLRDGSWFADEMDLSSPEQALAHGVATTDAHGQATIRFHAAATASALEEVDAILQFAIAADVTDLTGETRSGNTTLPLSRLAIQADIGLSRELHIDSLVHIALNFTNLSDQSVAAKGFLRLQRLRASSGITYSRLWELPDVFTLPEAAFRRDFPGLAWQGEEDPTQWPTVGQPIEHPIDQVGHRLLDLRRNVAPGWYRVQLEVQDAYGQVFNLERFMRIWDDHTRFGGEPQAIQAQTVVSPGQTASLWIGADTGPLHVLFCPVRADGRDTVYWTQTERERRFDLPVTERDEGGLFAHWFVVRHNRYYHRMVNWHVPFSSKALHLDFETFRDKLAPGQQEEWRLKISGPKKEKVAAAVAATLYDASLDQFLPFYWHFSPFWPNDNLVQFNAPTFETNEGNTLQKSGEMPFPTRNYPQLNWFNFLVYSYDEGLNEPTAIFARYDTVVTFDPETYDEGPQIVTNVQTQAPKPFSTTRYSPPVVQSDQDVMEELPLAGRVPSQKPAPPPLRRNLQETVFFFPELYTDSSGGIILKFTMNEALTRWKLLVLAHTRELQYTLAEKTVVTQKELMVLPNPPRFLREGDVMEFSAKVSNLSQENTSGTATLSLLDAETLQPVEAKFGLANRSVPFSVATGQSTAVAWKIQVPEGYAGAVTWQVFAEGKRARDGEESTLPVVSNRMLVTETLPITLRGKQTKTFVFDNFKNGAKAGDKSSLKTHQYTLEFSSNPAWYAVQALPYLMEFPHECSEQVFSRFYANTLAQSATEKMPNIRRIYDRWKGTDALKSNLSKNQELKYALLEETPWVMDAQNEAQQKQNIALLFDLNRMADERERAIATLAERQYDGGGWPWFPGGREDWYITQHILTGFAHLDKLGAFSKQNDPKVARMLDKALGFCARKLAERYEELNKLAQAGKLKMEDDHLESMAVQYLYARSFFLKGQEDNKPDKVTGYYLDQAAKYWLGKGLYQEGLIALAMYRFGRPETAQKIVASLKERATVKEELGMYWPFDWGFYWYQLPIETQALMVEVFSEVAKDPAAVENLRIWLLKNKQTNRWESTKATAEAVYALLLNGDNWLANTKPVQVSLGGRTLKPAEYEAGTGYFKQQWGASEVKPSWSEIKVENPNSNIVWGAAYWQYFEDLDKIRDFQKTPLTIVKQLFKEENTATGPVLSAVKEGQSLKPGDKIKVRIEIRVDRQMEYVHLKDLRAAGLEPVNVLSGYRWQGGLGYYESTKDLATHFFIDYLPKGTFVFEYPLVVSLKGDFSNGITTMQCMYAPEFTSHSKGVRVRVE